MFCVPAETNVGLSKHLPQEADFTGLRENMESHGHKLIVRTRKACLRENSNHVTYEAQTLQLWGFINKKFKGELNNKKL